MLPLDLKSIGAAYYTANCHKWMCTPKGSGLLHVRRDKQPGLHPLVLSHGMTSKRTDRSRFRLEFDWTGTDDPSPFLCIGEAIRHLGGLLPGGWAAVRARNRFLALASRDLLCQALKIKEPSPPDMIGSLAAVPLPDAKEAQTGQFDLLQDKLYRDHHIEVPVFSWPEPPKRLLRIAVQLYNSAAQYQKLANVLTTAA
jgi:isopenicillin-N epimerase